MKVQNILRNDSEAEHHKKVVDYFEKSRLGYDIVLGGTKHFGFYPDTKKYITEKKAQDFMQDLIAKNLNIKKNQLILDAGCGQGVVSTYLVKKYGCKIIGITIVPFEVHKARNLAKTLGLMDVEYHLMDYSNTRFNDNQFDAIYTMESFVHSPTTIKTIQEFFRILKPGGRLALFEYTKAPDSKFSPQEKESLDLIIEGSAMASLNNMEHNSFSILLKKVGFKLIKEQDISQHFLPSIKKLNKLAKFPYYILIKPLSLQKNFINVTAAIEFYKMAKRGLVKYHIFTAIKPKINKNI